MVTLDNLQANNKRTYIIMRTSTLLFFVFILSAIACNQSTESTGVVNDVSRQRLLPYQVWTPEITGKTFPLILLSHGSGGAYSNHLWLINALVDQGYMVAALNHPSNTTGDNNDTGIISVWERPQDLSHLLDHVLASNKWSSLIDQTRIAATGFSSGGYSVLALGGAIYKRELMEAYCRSKDHAADCELATDYSEVEYANASLSYKDTRIQSIFAMAPVVGPAITQTSLEKIDVPVFIIATQDDELVSSNLSASRYAEYIPNAQLKLLPNGGHFIFLECTFIISIADWFISELDLCGKGFSVDRPSIRGKVAAQAITFFNETIGDSSR